MSQSSWLDVEYLYYWPENERIKQAVNDGRFDVVYTMPGLKSNELLVDKIAQSIIQSGNQPIVRPNYTENIDGLKQLISYGNLRAAYNLTTKLLTNYGQGLGQAGHPSKNTFETFEIWSCRLQLLVALRDYSQLQAELSAFDSLDAPDTYFQYYQEYKNQGYYGSMIPYSLRLIHAEAPRYSPEPALGIKKCCDLELITRSIIEWMENEKKPESQIKLWKERLDVVLMTKARVWFTMKEYGQVITIYTDLLKTANDENRVKYYQALCRLSVMIGDEKLLEKYSKELTIQNSGTQSFYIHKGYKAAFNGNYAKAVEHFQSAQKGSSNSSNPIITNNEAVCHLYNGKADECRSTLFSFPNVPNEPMLQNANTVCQLIATLNDNSKQQYFFKNADKMNDILDPISLKLVH